MEISLRKARERLFDISDSLKRIFSFFSLISVLVLYIYIFSKMSSFPLEKEKLVEYCWYLLLVGMISTIATVLNKNLHLSKESIKISYSFAIITNGYLYFIGFYLANQEPDSWAGFSNLFIYYIIFMALDLLWVIFIFYFERKTRPYFSYHLLWKIVSRISAILLLFAARYYVDNFIDGTASFGALTPLDITILLFASIAVIVWSIATLSSFLYLMRYSVYENYSYREITLLSAFIRLFGVFVWATFSFSLYNFGLYEIIYAATTIVLIIGLTFIYIFKARKIRSRFLLELMAALLTFMAVVAFWIVDNTSASTSIIFTSLVLLLLYTQIMLIISQFNTSDFYSFVNSIISYVLILFAFMVWIENNLFGEGNALDTKKLIWGLATIIISLLLVSSILSLYFATSRIKANIKRIFKLEKKAVKNG